VTAGLAEAIAAQCGIRIDPATWQSVGGGSINRAARLSSDAGPLFLKTNRADRLEMFAAEAEGLSELAAADAVRVPGVHGWGVEGGRSWLLLEYLELSSPDATCRRRLGERLAALHRHTAARHGWHRDNTIGSTPQPNSPDDDWVRFLADRRLRFQLDLAIENGYGSALSRDGERLLDALPAFFADYRPEPSLLHGDLWGGNFAACEGEPVIFDPAVYYGDRETDLAMTELFGGFGGEFYAAYEEAWPLDAGYPVRRDLYQLYHVLNHLNLFGGGYLGRARSLVGRLLAAA
jgi:protein-ribulosamine 3-kinase